MAKGKPPTRWERAPHTKAKHDLLVRYLQAWFAIFGGSRHHDRVLVIDGFAGPGLYADGEPGSPVLTLEALLGHDHFDRWSGTTFVFRFNERDPDRVASLDQVLTDLEADWGGFPKNVKVKLDGLSFVDWAEALLGRIKPGYQLVPTFSFVDPFGYADVPLDLIKRLVSHPAGELFIYFDINSAVRFATAGNVDSALDALFGTDEYKDAPSGAGGVRERFLHDLYERQLRQECGFTYVRSFGMVGANGKSIAYLFFCTKDLRAFDRMKAAMWKIAPSGDYRFEDRLADQPVLFGDEDATMPLKSYLLDRFAGQTVLVDKIVKDVIENTPFYSGQVKLKTLAPMQRAGMIDAVNQTRKSTFKDGVVSVVFPPLR